MSHFNSYFNKEKKTIKLKNNLNEITVESWLISEIERLDNAGVEIIACIYDWENHKKYILINQSSRDIAIKMGYFPIKYNLSGNVEIMSYHFRETL